MGDCPGRISGVLLWRVVRVPLEQSHERDESRDRADPRASHGSLPVKALIYEFGNFQHGGSEMRADGGEVPQDPLRGQRTQRRAQTLSEHASERMRMPMTRSHMQLESCSVQYCCSSLVLSFSIRVSVGLSCLRNGTIFEFGPIHKCSDSFFFLRCFVAFVIAA
jgi:hypothetical protein